MDYKWAGNDSSNLCSKYLVSRMHKTSQCKYHGWISMLLKQIQLNTACTPAG